MPRRPGWAALRTWRAAAPCQLALDARGAAPTPSRRPSTPRLARSTSLSAATDASAPTHALSKAGPSRRTLLGAASASRLLRPLLPATIPLSDMLAVPPAPRQWSERSRQLNAILQRPGAAAALRLVRARVCPDQAGRPIDSSAGIDLALALLWTLPTTRLALSPPDRAALARVPDLMLHEADYAPIRNVQRGGPGLVDLVRSRHDGCVYVLKSTLKGAAARESYRINPLIEKRIFLQALAPCAQRHGLSEHHDSSQAREDLPIPRLHAAFQSRAATHLVIEYCPAGDLESLLASAGAANSCYPGRSSIPGGLLSESWVVAYGKDICSAVAWLHDLGFAHRYI